MSLPHRTGRSHGDGPAGSETLAILFTLTTYGTWLRGDRRGWVREGVTYAADPPLEARDRAALLHEPFLFLDEQWYEIGKWVGTELISRLDLTIYALTVQRWHLHLVVRTCPHPVGRIVKCAKEAVRYHLRPGRPICTDGYDKRFCFDEQSVFDRVAYVERHNTERGRAARPWEFLTDWRAVR